MRHYGCLLAAGVAAIMSGRVSAAEVTFEDHGDFNVIGISGEIALGDVPAFARIANSSGGKPTVVDLNSIGGNLVAGLSIGEVIHARNFRTAVRNGAVCASVCGLIWLSGRDRWRGARSFIGFHAAYMESETGAQATSQGNAIVGAYLAKLGFSYGLIAYATEAAPADMKWLTAEDARRLGVSYHPIPTATAPAAPERTVSAEPDAAPAERQAIRLVERYYDFWSKGGADVSGLAEFYSERPVYYGAATTRDKVMVEKQKFSVHWPVRHYTIKPGTVFAQCGDVCSVAGVVQWDVASAERNAHSTGVANFVLRIAPSATGGRILSENGAVLSSHNEALSLPATPDFAAATVPAASPGYAAGRRARLDYEAWFDGLPPGEFRDGAGFWAANRSLRPAPSCWRQDKGTDWQAGCATAQRRLSPSDVRRQTEPDFRSGWNSL